MEMGVHQWFEQCVLPDDTELQEHTLQTRHCIVIGDRCRIDYGLKGDDVIISEFSTINGSVTADGDVRIDNWCVVSGDVFSEADVYLGEGVRIQGRLIVAGDLDIGDNVQIEKGFEAKGWISIRNPMPVIAYLMLYLVTLLGIEREDEINEMMQKLFGYDDEDDEVAEIPLMIPSHSVLNMETFSVPHSMSIGARCRLHGNIRAGSIAIMEENTIFGSLRSENGISLREGSTIHGDISSKGDVIISGGAHVLGDVHCRTLSLHEQAHLDGTIVAPEGVRIERA